MSPHPSNSDCAGSEIKDLIDTYAQTLDARDREEATFFSFAKLAKCILARACPDDAPRVKFVTTDPKRILDSRQRVTHSPDVVVVLENYLSCKGFGWKHALSTFEFELRQIQRPKRRECEKCDRTVVSIDLDGHCTLDYDNEDAETNESVEEVEQTENSEGPTTLDDLGLRSAYMVGRITRDGNFQMHAINAVIADTEAHISLFISMTIGVRSCSLNNWGIYPSFEAPPLRLSSLEPSSRAPRSLETSSLSAPTAAAAPSCAPCDGRIELKDGTALQVVKVLSQCYGVEGTRIVKARKIVDNTGEGLADRNLVVKISCVRESCRSTSPIIAAPHGQVEQETDNSASQPKRVSRELSDGDANTRGPFPRTHSSEALRADFEVLEQRIIEHRGRCIIPEGLSPLIALPVIPEHPGQENFTSIIQDIAECIVRLSESQKILHRDINVDNVMYRQMSDTVCGILGDPDLAAPIVPVAGSHFTIHGNGSGWGALPLLRHDIESFMLRGAITS